MKITLDLFGFKREVEVDDDYAQDVVEMEIGSELRDFLNNTQRILFKKSDGDVFRCEEPTKNTVDQTVKYCEICTDIARRKG